MEAKVIMGKLLQNYNTVPAILYLYSIWIQWELDFRI